MRVFNLIRITFPPEMTKDRLRVTDTTEVIKVLEPFGEAGESTEFYQPVAFSLSAFETKKDSIGNAEASAPFSYYFTTELNYLLSGCLIEIWQSENNDVNINDIPKVFEGYIGNIKQSEKTTYEIISNLFLLKKYTGKRVSKYCYKDLGDSECGVNLLPHTYSIQITTGYDRGLNGITLGSCPDLPTGAFTDGKLQIENNAIYTDQRTLIQGDYHIFTDVRLTANTRRIWLSQVGSAARIDPQACKIIRGCDHTSITCQGVYNNIKKFGGFEFLPGNDRLFASN